MNIQQAKEEIIRTFRAYMKRNPDGTHCIPVAKQRPLLLIGPPGIGKTAIMYEIAEETGCGLLAYSMTHHTRQSAIGLPFISHKEYDGRTYSVTEYTMSEIVASIYEYMEKTGKKQGILFLDEINCVSETLTPVMLQLLQNKTFGNVPLPEDWIIAAAGNPPEYNKSVRELDMVTLDRVKNMEITADLPTWQHYALEKGVHPAIRTYLSMYPDHFYNITDTDRGQLFVTARGWEDLSLMLLSYEEDGEPVTPEFFLEYLQHDDIARSFAVYYDLFRSFTEEIKENASSGQPEDAFHTLLRNNSQKMHSLTATECLAVAAILFHRIQIRSHAAAAEQKELDRLYELVSLIPQNCDFGIEKDRNAFLDQKRNAVRVRASHGLVLPEDALREEHLLTILASDAAQWLKSRQENKSAEPFKEYEDGILSDKKTAFETEVSAIRGEIEDAFALLEKAPQGGTSLLYLANDLSGDADTAAILSENAPQLYLKYCSELLTQE